MNAKCALTIRGIFYANYTNEWHIVGETVRQRQRKYYRSFSFIVRTLHFHCEAYCPYRSCSEPSLAIIPIAAHPLPPESGRHVPTRNVRQHREHTPRPEIANPRTRRVRACRFLVNSPWASQPYAPQSCYTLPTHLARTTHMPVCKPCTTNYTPCDYASAGSAGGIMRPKINPEAVLPEICRTKNTHTRVR